MESHLPKAPVSTGLVYQKHLEHKLTHIAMQLLGDQVILTTWAGNTLGHKIALNSLSEILNPRPLVVVDIPVSLASRQNW
jgi:hypothetical protein